MVFASYIFLFGFLPLTLTLYYLLPAQFRSLFLTLVSYVFLGWWRPDFVLLLLFSTVVDWALGEVIASAEKQSTKKWAVAASVVVNLGMLGYFKYFNFGMENLNRALGWFGHEPIAWTRVVLPIGISFYAFQTITYTVDLYRGNAQKARNLMDYACYVSLFPHLVAGPILRYNVMDQQLRSRTHTLDKFAQGCFMFMLGLAKKVLIADNLASTSDAAFSSLHPGGSGAWFGLLAYTFQLYFDFSGYSDMAIGLALMIGFQIPKNFDSPFKSKSVTEIWRRWHISLSTWLRDYLYIPLGGNRHGIARTYFAVAAVMILGGFWHGAQWTFVLWGAYNGLFLVLERMLERRALWAWLPGPLQVAAAFLFWIGGMAIFRSESLHGLGVMIRGLAGLQGWEMAGAIRDVALKPITLYAMTVAPLIVWGGKQTWDLSLQRSAWKNLGALALFAMSVLHLFFHSYRPFLYYQF